MNKAQKIISKCLAISLIVSCAVFSYAAPTQPAPVQKSTIAEEELQRIAELSSDKYNHLLQVWSKDPNYPSDTDANFPDFYGGAYVDDNKELVILVTILNDETIDYFGNLIDLEHVRFSLADNSFQELLYVQETIENCLDSNSLDENSSALITGTGISIKENAVIVYAATEDLDNICNSFTRVYSARNSQPYNIRFRSLWMNTDPVRYTVPEQNNETFPYNVSGILVQPGGPVCVHVSGNKILPTSVGFWAKNSSGELGIVTAAHGEIQSGQSVYASKTGYYRDEYFGYISNAICRDEVDAAFVKRNTSDPERFPPVRYVDGWDFNLKSTTRLMAEGEEIYKKGIETGVTRGKVTDINFNPNSYDSTIKLTSAVLTDCVADVSDSGGIVAGGGTTSSRYVVGIVAGGMWYGTPSGQTTPVQMYYSKAPSILSALKLTLY